MPSVENALLISKVIEINLTTLNSHFSLILHLQLACSKYHICASFISVIFSNIIFISEHEFRWLIDEKCHYFFLQISFWYNNNHITSLKSKYIYSVFLGAYIRPFFLTQANALFGAFSKKVKSAISFCFQCQKIWMNWKTKCRTFHKNWRKVLVKWLKSVLCSK